MGAGHGMRWNDVTPISLLAGLFAALGAKAALAVEPTRCTTMVVEADVSLRDRWPDLPGEIRAAFEIRGDIDTCARIEMVMPDAAIVVRVALTDGRTASRSVSKREDVLPALEALLLLPDDSATG